MIGVDERAKLPLPLALLLEHCEHGGGRFGYDMQGIDAYEVVQWFKRTPAKLAGVEGVNREDHDRRMAEWRESNDNGKCGRVANDLIHYIDEVLMPGASRGELPDTSREVLGAQVPTARADLVGTATEFDPKDTHHPPGTAFLPTCKTCTAFARNGYIEHAKSCYAFSSEGGGREPVDMPAGSLAGKLPSERFDEIGMAEFWNGDPEQRGGLPFFHKILMRLLDERLGRA